MATNHISSNDDIAKKILENPKLLNEISEGNNFVSTSLISDKAMVTHGEINNGVEEKLKPAYIVCFDKIHDKDIKTAEDFNIPIYLIDRKYYYSYIQSRADRFESDINVGLDDDFARKLKIN